jgi:hypothetical protein
VLDVELGPRHHGRVVNVVSSVAEVDSSKHARSLLSTVPVAEANITCRHA